MTPEQKTKRNEYQRRWCRENPAKTRAYKAANYKRNPKTKIAQVRRWYLKNPEKKHEYDARRYQENRAKTDAATRKWNAAHPEKRRSFILKNRYGLTTADWDALFASQGSRCGCCGDPEPHHKHGWHTDHDHATGKVRGIICWPCNRVLTRYVNAQSLTAAAHYLQRAEK